MQGSDRPVARSALSRFTPPFSHSLCVCVCVFAPVKDSSGYSEGLKGCDDI